MKSRTTASFWRHFGGLPKPVQRQATKAFRTWRQNPAQPGLAFKRVHPTEPVYSVRVSRGHRALGLLEGDTVTWFWIGSHADYDRLV